LFGVEIEIAVEDTRIVFIDEKILLGLSNINISDYSSEKVLKRDVLVKMSFKMQL